MNVASSSLGVVACGGVMLSMLMLLMAGVGKTTSTMVP